MSTQFFRTELIYGKEAMKKLYSAKVAVFGVGGVGGHVIEALSRSGVGALDLFDNDKVCLTNLNRQIIATYKTIGQYKVDVAKDRILQINPNAQVEVNKIFYLPENADDVILSDYDYVVDAIDTVSAKIELVVRCKKENIRIISSMGAGNKIHASLFEVADIYKTSVCPLAKVMRRELKARNVDSLKVVYSKEVARTPMAYVSPDEKKSRKQVPGSNAFVPATAGLIIAGEVINDIIGIK